MSFSSFLQEHRRLAVLKVLAEGGYSANESLITDVVRSYGVAATRDQVRGELGWLAEQGLVTTSTVAHLVIATITHQGLDVATGQAVYPGVKRPGPGG